MVTKYPYDPARAQALMSEAGWNRALDGVLVNAQGERFVIDGRTGTQEFQVQLQSAVIDYWKRIGVEVQINNLTARQQSEEYRGRFSCQVGLAELRGRAVPPLLRQRQHPHCGEALGWQQRVALGRSPEGVHPDRDGPDLRQPPARRPGGGVQSPLLGAAPDHSFEIPGRGHVGAQGHREPLPRNELGGENTRTWNAEQWDWQ